MTNYLSTFTALKMSERNETKIADLRFASKYLRVYFLRGRKREKFDLKIK